MSDHIPPRLAAYIFGVCMGIYFTIIVETMWGGISPVDTPMEGVGVGVFMTITALASIWVIMVGR